ncbi:hypothetical protein GJU94_13835 [Brucella sp. 10RB9214]|nr:hypothetical protein [Brucella sp. 10RB9212]MRN50895.1 hypothetical protein [Brucella sp. 10RB9214]
MPTHNSLLHICFRRGIRFLVSGGFSGHAESTADVSVGSVPFEIYGPCGVEAMRLLSAVFIMALLLEKWFLSIKGENPWEDVHSVACHFVIPTSIASVDDWTIWGLIPFVNVIFPILSDGHKKCRKRGIVIYHYRNVRCVFVEPVAAAR